MHPFWTLAHQFQGPGWRLAARVGLICLAASSGCASGPFVCARDGRFFVEARRHVFVGVNFWQAVHMAMRSPYGDRDRLHAELDYLGDLGVTNVRILAGFEGPDTEPYRATPAMLTAPGVYNADVLDGLDYLLAQLAQRRMHAVVALTNFWEWSGGMAQYTSWHDGTAIPYPATHGWREYCDYAARFYECDQCQRWFRNHIERIVTRTNPYTGRRYSDEPAIFAWELANEPRYYPPKWIAETAAFIKALDPNHLITTGSEGEVGGDFAATHRSRHIDYATIHIWPQNWGWFDPARPSSYTEAQTRARQYFDRHAAMARDLGKPMVLEEFGLARDTQPPGDPYDPQSSTTVRDRMFAAMLGWVRASAEAGGPVAGSNLWVWAGEARPGQRWIGDPPHESPGWYSVYDKDESTLRIIKRHAEELAELGRHLD